MAGAEARPDQSPDIPVEERKEQPFTGKTFLITAGATGTGLFIARDLHSLDHEFRTSR